MRRTITYLLLVTEDGFGRRVAVDDVRRTKGRNAVGVNISRVPVAAALVVDSTDAEVVIATANGKVERLRVGDVPTRRRSDPNTGRMSKGLRVIRLEPGDRVASVALSTPVEMPPPATNGGPWVGGRVGLEDGESVAQATVFTRVLDVAEIEPGGEPAIPAEEWARTEVHRHSSYWCVHCGASHPDPEAVYGCIDRHAASEFAATVGRAA